MTDLIYLQKQARICREMAAEVGPTEAVGLVELASAYEDQVRWIVKGRSAFEFGRRTGADPALAAANDPGSLGPDF